MPRTLRILTTDNTGPMLGALAEALAGTPYEVVKAATGPEVLLRAHEDRPDLILLGLQLPVLDGLRVLELLGSDPATAGIPAVAIGNSGDDAAAARALGAGAALFLQKPLPAHEVCAVIRRLLALP